MSSTTCDAALRTCSKLRIRESANECEEATPLTRHCHAHVKVKTVATRSYRSISTSPPPSPTCSSDDGHSDDDHSVSSSSSSSSSPPSPWYCKLSNWVKLCIMALLLSFLVIAAVHNKLTISESQRFIAWMDSHPIQGSFAFVALYALCSVLLIPGSILTLGAGFVYCAMFGQLVGVVLAALVVWVGASAGATLAFLNGRYLLRGVVTHYTAQSAKFAMIDQVVGINGFKVTFLLRLSPITPYNVFNYFMGLTSVSVKHYVMAHFGMIPDALVYCFIGGSIASITKLSSVGFASDPVLLVGTITGTVVSIAGIVWISFTAKKEFEKMAAESMLLVKDGDDGEHGEDEDEERFGLKKHTVSMGVAALKMDEAEFEEDHDVEDLRFVVPQSRDRDRTNRSRTNRTMASAETAML